LCGKHGGHRRHEVVPLRRLLCQGWWPRLDLHADAVLRRLHRGWDVHDFLFVWADWMSWQWT